MRANLSYLVIIAILFAATSAQAERAAATQGAAGSDLAAVQNIKHFVGTAAARTILARNRFVVTDKQFKQIFAAYIGSAIPKFITTDSAWHTYHVLMEEGVKQLEEAQAGRLREFSGKLVAAARQRAKAGQAGYEQLAHYASVGLALQDPAYLKPLEKESPAAAAVVRALQSGVSLVQVPIGLPLMPQRFRAKSFYTRSPQLAAYFAARQWYAVVVFRLNSKDETALALELAGLVKGDAELNKLHDRLSTPYDLLLAPAEDGDVRTYAKAAADHKTVEAARKHLASRLADPKVNDQILLPAQYENFAAEIKGFRLLPPRRVPSAVCFQNTVDPKIKGRMFPSGLDFLAACKTLRSPAAERAIQIQSGKAAAQAIGQAGPAKLPDSLHGQALKLLAKLQQPVGKAAPAAMKTDTWRDKQLWTQLGAWAEQRHTWALHTKLTVHYLGMTREHPGIVSPYPDFFDGLGALSRATAKALAAMHLAKDFDPRKAAKDLLGQIQIFNRIQSAMATTRPGVEKTQEEIEALRAMATKAENLMEFLMLYSRKFEVPVKSEKEAEALLKQMAKMAGKCAAGGELKKTEIETLKLFVYSSSTGKVDSLLNLFAGVCDTLANIARKQLAGKKLTRQDRAFIENYGIILAKFHFYGGNSYLTPKDDFPIVTPIFVSPPGNQSAILYAGLARPQALYVIATVDARPVLHLGAVLSYREFRRAVCEPLDDAAWREQVHKGPLPAPPKFTESFAAGITPEEVIEILAKGKTYEDIDNVPGREITKAIIRILDKGASRQTHWLVDHLINRCTDQDAGDLIRLMAKIPEMSDQHLALKVSELPWKAHRDALMAMLHSAKPKLADMAAYVMSRRPGDIDYEPLLAAFDKQPIRTRRLYCFLLGYAPKADPRLTKTLLKALGDSDAGLRWQAVTAIAQGGLKDAAVVKALVARIEDANEFVASAAVRALAKLKASEAAPAMLARLKRGVRPSGLTSSESRKQEQAILGATDYGGRTDLMVLRPRDGFGFGGLTCLGRALVGALARFRYNPAKDQLVKMLDGDYCDEAIEALKEVAPEGLKERLLGMITGKNATSALEALEKMEPDKHVARLITVALDRKADPFSRRTALLELRSKGGAATAARLIPLLDDTTGFKYDDRQMCDYAAAAMGAMLGWRHASGPVRDAEVRKKLIARLKKWAKDRTATSGPSK